MKKIVLLLTLCLSFMFGLGQYDLSKNVDKQIIFVPKKGMELQAKTHFNNGETKIVTEFEQLGWYVILIPNGVSQDEFINRNKSLNFVENLYKDETLEMQMDYIPNDAQFAACWHLKQSTDKDIDADEAWDLVPANNPFVSVAMFDGGLDLTIPDLAANINSPFNAVNSTTSIPYVNSEDKHGTACSGTIAAVTNNSIGVSSVGNNKVKVMPVNIMSAVFAGGSFQTTSTIQINAVNAAMANPTCVAIAMSYGGSSYSASLDAAFQSARTTARGGKGMVVVASSGNGYSGTAAQYPANYSGVWGIGATSQSDVRASFSNFGQICDISAPGVGILTTDRLGTAGYDPGDYRSVSGTSFSCPITAAAAAFVFYKNWELTDDQVLQILSQTAEKVGGYTYSNDPLWPYSTRSNELGYGRINLKDAINATPNPGGVIPPPPPPTQIHNFVINQLSVSPTTVTVGSNITITATIATQNPTYPQVNVMTQHRLSTNTTWGDADDIIIGTTSGNLGGGISSDFETIVYNVGNITGIRYIISRANYMGSVSETNLNDNTAQTSFTITQPTVPGGDLSAQLTIPSTPSITISPTQTTVNFQWKITNTGSVPITTFTWDRMWLTIPESPRTWPTSTSWQGPLMPGQFIYLPGGGIPTNPTSISYLSTSICFSTAQCALPLGSTNTFRMRILSVNGGSGDGNLANNQVECVVTRLATAVNNDGLIDTPEVKFVEVRQFSNLYEKPIRYGSIDEAILEKGLNVIHIHHSDGTVEIKKISVN